MNSIDYYETKFPEDLKRIIPTLTQKYGISFVSLTSKNMDESFHFGKTQKAFLSSESPYKFLFCFFFTVLLDQTVYTVLRSEYRNFEKITQYPKFLGIFMSYNSNMPPSLLLLIATMYTEKENKDGLIEEFKDLTIYMLDTYIDFFLKTFPEYSFFLKNKTSQEQAIKEILRRIHLDLSWENVPKSLATVTPDIELYRAWIITLNREIENKLIKYQT